MDIDEAREKFRDFLKSIQEKDQAPFLHWIERSYFMATCRGEAPAIASSKLNRISEFVRDLLPQNALLPSENFVTPTKGENSDCDPATTIHVDAFLYPDEKIDELCDEGKMTRHYCGSCGSKDTKPLTFISHSTSKQRASFIFSNLVGWLKDKSVLDIGSRLGVLCYAAYLHTPASPIVGVEMNEDFCKLQQQVVDKFEMGDRVKIMHSDIMQLPDVVRTSDVVVVNNAFEFFTDDEKQRQIWKFIHDNTKTGSILVTVPPLEDTFANLGITSDIINVDKWVTKKHVTDPLTYHYVLSHDELGEIASYEVIKK